MKFPARTADRFSGVLLLAAFAVAVIAAQLRSGDAAAPSVTDGAATVVTAAPAWSPPERPLSRRDVASLPLIVDDVVWLTLPAVRAGGGDQGRP